MSKLYETIKALTEDMNDRIENIKAIKGEPFAIAVRAAVSLNSISQLSCSAAPKELRRLILPEMCAEQLKYLCQILNLSVDDAHELIILAKGISMQVEDEVTRATTQGDQHG